LQIKTPKRGWIRKIFFFHYLFSRFKDPKTRLKT
jgi:hypothetical protein